VRKGERRPADVFNDLEDVDTSAYQNENFRELLFGVDSLNILEGPRWTEIFVRRLVEYSDWIVNGKLMPRAYIEISEYQETYGRGEYSIGLVLDLNEEASAKPVNSTSFMRRTIREHFNGIQPINDHALFLVKRYFDSRSTLEKQDLELLFHVGEETKGLENARGFDRFFAKTIRNKVVNDDGEVDRVALIATVRVLETSDDVTTAEKLLIRELKNRDVEMPDSILGQIDLSRDRLMGMA
jgi:hypothetical protein